MAKKCMLEKEARRIKLAKRYFEKRQKLRAIINDPNTSMDEKDDAYRQINNMPRDASRVRTRNRCRVTGRPRGYLRKFEMSRIALRDLASKGLVPGVTKSSW